MTQREFVLRAEGGVHRAIVRTGQVSSRWAPVVLDGDVVCVYLKNLSGAASEIQMTHDPVDKEQSILKLAAGCHLLLAPSGEERFRIFLRSDADCEFSVSAVVRGRSTVSLGSARKEHPPTQREVCHDPFRE